MRQQLRITILASLFCLSLTTLVRAQDDRQAALPRRASAYSAPGCDDGKTLVCPDQRSAPAKKRRANSESLGAISKFAKLAGMFMGRVDAADIGSFKFRFKLELADAHDFMRE